MPAPRRPNWEPGVIKAAEIARRRRLTAMATELREAGYTVTAPDEPAVTETTAPDPSTEGTPT